VVAPFADILAAASQTPVANEDASTRATFISVSPCFSDGESAWARTEKARAPKTSTRSRWLAPACARRKCVVLARLSSARPRVVRAFRRLRAKLFDDEPRRHLLTASEGTAQVATTRASTGLTV
jgi:hypothetical protein